MIVHRQILYAGRVQGVGFRYTVKQIASGYEVVGWVRNLADGRVELHIEGDAGELDAFIVAVAASHLASGIKELTSTDLSSPRTACKGFQVLH